MEDQSSIFYPRPLAICNLQFAIDMDDEQRNHLEELLRTHQANLRHLEQQAAQHGIDVPVVVKNGIDHERAEIAHLEGRLGRIADRLFVAALDFDEPRFGQLRAERPPGLLGSRRDNLPAQTTPLIGREREVAAVCALLLRPDIRLVTLTGPGGASKTRLALQIATDLLDAATTSPLPLPPTEVQQRERGLGGEGQFPDGAFFVALAPIYNPDLVMPTIAQALGVRKTGGQDVLAALKSELRDRRLLLLDNFEQIVDAAPVVSELLEAAPGLKALITSREALKLYGEHEFVVPPLALPDLHHLPPLDQVAEYAAIRLFAERAQSTRAGFTLTSANASAVAGICARLDGLLLAIELAAARSKLFAPEKLLAQLTSRLRLLTGCARNLPERQRTLRGAIDWSYNLTRGALCRIRSKILIRRAIYAHRAAHRCGVPRPSARRAASRCGPPPAASRPSRYWPGAIASAAWSRAAAWARSTWPRTPGSAARRWPSKRCPAASCAATPRRSSAPWPTSGARRRCWRGCAIRICRASATSSMRTARTTW
jgi:hypothetical protein